jgi:hypothetical protein
VSQTKDGWNEGFTGGPPRLFEKAGREQLIVLLEHDLAFESTVLDIGCGALRGGRWVIPLLAPGHYFGIEPQRPILERGLRDFIDPRIVEIKQPRFDNNERFDFSVFGTTFTHFMARSIWTHASKPQIECMLDGVVNHGADNAVLLASYQPPNRWVPEYWGTEWVGRSTSDDAPGTVTHSYEWIAEAAERRGLVPSRIDRPPLVRGAQVWVAIRKAPSAPRPPRHP